MFELSQCLQIHNYINKTLTGAYWDCTREHGSHLFVPPVHVLSLGMFNLCYYVAASQ